MLFIDARNIFTQVDRAHRELSDEQIQNIALIPRLHKGVTARSSWTRWTATCTKAWRSSTEAAEHLPALSERLLDVLAEKRPMPKPAKPRALPSPRCKPSGNQLAALAQAQDQHERTRGQSKRGGPQPSTCCAPSSRPSSTGLHAAVKALDKAIREMDKRKAEAAKQTASAPPPTARPKGVKAAVQALHDELKAQSCTTSM